MIDRICALCGGAVNRVLLTITEPDRFERASGVVDEGYERRWVECENCGAATNVRGPGASEVLKLADRYYEIDLGGISVGEKFERIMALPADRSDNAGRVERIVSFLGDGRIGDIVFARGELRALDIGAGTGVFLSALRQRLEARGLTLDGWAIEPDPKAAAHLETLRDLHVVRDVFHPSPTLRDFGLCTLNKVLEHVEDPVDLIRQAATALAPNASALYVEVPDVLTITNRPPSDNILGVLHHHLYTPRALRCIADAADLVVQAITRVFEPSGKISLAAFLVTRATQSRLAELGGRA